MGLLMLLFTVLVLAGIVFLVWFIAASLRPGRAAPPPAQAETPLDILGKRYARGEITTEQYQEMKRQLEGQR